MAKGAIGHIGYAKFSCGVDEAVSLVQSLKRRVLGLNGIDLGDCGKMLVNSAWIRALELTRVGLSESRSRTLRQANVLGLSLLANLIESSDGLLEGSVCIGLEILFWLQS